MTELLYRMVKLPSEEAVQYVGVYVLKWMKTIHPEVGFIPVGNAQPPERTDDDDQGD